MSAPKLGDLLPGGWPVLGADVKAPGVVVLLVVDEAALEAGQSRRLAGEPGGPRVETSPAACARQRPAEPFPAGRGVPGGK